MTYQSYGSVKLAHASERFVEFDHDVLVPKQEIAKFHSNCQQNNFPAVIGIDSLAHLVINDPLDIKEGRWGRTEIKGELLETEKDMKLTLFRRGLFKRVIDRFMGEPTYKGILRVILDSEKT